MKIKESFVYISIVSCLVLFVGFPLLQPGFIPTHDGEYHIIRFHEFYTMLMSGYLFPRWAPGLNSGFGLPLFNFHYPFPNYIGALFHVLRFSLVDSFKLTLFTGYAVASFACFWWLKRMFGSFAACIGTVVFSFVPYWFVDIYVRGSVGEVLAIAFVMIALMAIEYKRYSVCALAVAGLILSHNILAMLFVPILCLYAGYQEKKLLAYFVLGVFLASYFWLPALAERSYMVGLNAVNFTDHFPDLFQLLIPSWGTGFSRDGASFDEMSQQIGIAPLLSYFLAFVLLLKEKKYQQRSVVAIALGMVVILSVLMLPASLPVWKNITFLQFLQYPWRLLSLFIPITGFLGAYIAKNIKKRWVAVIVGVFAVGMSLSYTRPVVYEPRSDVYYLSRKEFTDGTSSLGNSFSTIWSPWKQKRAIDKIELIRGKSQISNIHREPLLYTFRVRADQESRVRINTMYFPGWQVFMNGVEMPVDTTDGVLNVNIPRGDYSIIVTFRETPVRVLADALSFLSLFWLLILAILKGAYAHRHQHISAKNES